SHPWRAPPLLCQRLRRRPPLSGTQSPQTPTPLPLGQPAAASPAQPPCAPRASLPPSLRTAATLGGAPSPQGDRTPTLPEPRGRSWSSLLASPGLELPASPRCLALCMERENERVVTIYSLDILLFLFGTSLLFHVQF
ncbi:unnamed protein product, partial [Rangifer tarandus platyrhynchus]